MVFFIFVLAGGVQVICLQLYFRSIVLERQSDLTKVIKYIAVLIFGIFIPIILPFYLFDLIQQSPDKIQRVIGLLGLGILGFVQSFIFWWRNKRNNR